MEIRRADIQTDSSIIRKGASVDPAPQMAADSTDISSVRRLTPFDLSKITALFKKPDAAAVRSEIEGLYEKVIADTTADDDRSGIWEQIVTRSEEYLKMEGGFNTDSFEPMMRYATSDPDIQFVTLSAPRPYLAGTMASNWNFIQWKDEKGIHVQSLGKDTCDWYHDGKVWKDGDTTYLTGLGLAKGSSRDMGAYVSVMEKTEDGWVQVKNRFTSPVTHLEGHELYLSPNGSFSLENDMATDDVLEFSFIDNSSDISIKGKDEHILALQDGIYHLHPGKTKEERRQEQMKKELEESLTNLKNGDTEDHISIENDKVNIGGVTLPIKSPGE
ncbi:MAG: hypothetical protein AB9903_30170 [Vulcanimicrobiota bacterium]